MFRPGRQLAGTGLVVGFDPAAATELKRGSVLTVIVSSGHEPVGVPDVTGQTPWQTTSNLAAAGSRVAGGEDERTAALRAVGLTVDATKFKGSTVRLRVPKAREVFEQEPP